MHEALERRYVATVKRDLEELVSGASFERLLYALLSRIEPECDWLARGTTLSGAPLHTNVDAFGYCGKRKVVAEFSSLESYFDAQLAKPRSDLASVALKHPDAETIYLITNRDMSTRTAEVDTLKRSRPGLDIYDGRRIATKFVKDILDDDFVAYASAFLPQFELLASQWSLSHSIPSDPRYVQRIEAEEELRREMEHKAFVCLHGISGMGKSSICAAVARNNDGRFDQVFWIDARDIMQTEQLRDIRQSKRGQSVNVLDAANRHACLLVLDDFVHALDLTATTSALHSHSRILATSQRSLPGSIAIRPLSKSEGAAILGSDCPLAVADQLLAACAGLPLALRLCRAWYDDSGDWSQVVAAVERPATLEDASGNKLAVRLLSQHTHSFSTELQFLSWVAKDTVIDADLWQEMFGLASLRSCLKRGFFAAGPMRTVRVHSLIQAASHEVYPNVTDEMFIARIIGAFEGLFKKRSPSLSRITANSSWMIARLLRAGRHAPVLQAALAMSRERSEYHLLKDPISLASNLEAIGKASHIELRAILESVEALASAGDRQKRKELIATFVHLAGIQYESDSLERDVLHHHAKLLGRDGDGSEALIWYSKLLARWPSFWPAHLQQARLHARKGKASEAWASVKAILDAEAASRSAVAPTVFLSAIQLLGDNVLRSRAAEVLEGDPSVARILKDNLDVLHELAFETIKKISYSWRSAVKGYVYLMAGLLDEAVPLTASAKFSWAQALKAYGRALDSMRSPPAPYYERALLLYREVDGRDDFEIQQHAECHILLGRSAEAIRLLDDCKNIDGDHWHHFRALALELANDLPAALQEAGRALEATKADSPWLADFERTHRRLNDKQAPSPSG